MRTLPTTVSAAVAQDATQPIYLVRLGFATEVRAATWGEAITWNSESWIASGIEVRRLTATSAQLVLPNGDDDPWLSLVLNDGTRGRSISIYEHHTDTASSPQTDAALLFTGVMDEATITDQIRVKVIESSQAKTFPPSATDAPDYNFLLDSGTRIQWGADTIVVN